MSKIIMAKGDLVQAYVDRKVDTFVHGANCFQTMGAGIANQVRLQMPELYMVDQEADSSKRVLGSYTWVAEMDENRKISRAAFNLYTQVNPGLDAKLGAVYFGLRDISTMLRSAPNAPRVLNIPLIGCGIGGLNPNQLFQILEEAARRSEVLDINIWTL